MCSRREMSLPDVDTGEAKPPSFSPSPPPNPPLIWPLSSCPVFQPLPPPYTRLHFRWMEPLRAVISLWLASVSPSLLALAPWHPASFPSHPAPSLNQQEINTCCYVGIFVVDVVSKEMEVPERERKGWKEREATWAQSRKKRCEGVKKEKILESRKRNKDIAWVWERRMGELKWIGDKDWEETEVRRGNF